MVIGITGGVGCGKSTVLHILKEKFGCHILEADKVGHLLMEPGQPVYEQIVAAFGTGILADNRAIDRGILGKIVFHDKEQLQQLNRIVHPAVKEYIKNQIKQVLNSKKDGIIVVEAALLLEDHYDSFCDEVWYIYAEQSVRMKRLQESRGYTEEKTIAIMKNQLTEEAFLARCQRKIDNSYDLEHTYMQIKDNIIDICGGNLWQK